MKITVIGAGNSGLAMAAHMAKEGEVVCLWNRSRNAIDDLLHNPYIYCSGAIEGRYKIDCITTDIRVALKNVDLILVAIPAYGHSHVAKLIAKNINKRTIIVLNPGKVFGALEFKKEYEKYNKKFKQKIVETQTVIYTSRKTSSTSVDIISMKKDILLSPSVTNTNEDILQELPRSLQEHFVVAKSLVETSIGNVGMILHSAPLLFNIGLVESKSSYEFYHNAISKSVGKFLEGMDEERVRVASLLGHNIETTEEWLQRIYKTTGSGIYENINNNKLYREIMGPKSLEHRYISEDIPFGLVPLEHIGQQLGIEMVYTGLIIDVASMIKKHDFRAEGRKVNLSEIKNVL